MNIKYDINIDSIGFKLEHYDMLEFKRKLSFFHKVYHGSQIVHEARIDINESYKIIAKVESKPASVSIEKDGSFNKYLPYLQISLTCGTTLYISYRPIDSDEMINHRFENIPEGPTFYINIGGLYPYPKTYDNQSLINIRKFLQIIFFSFRNEEHELKLSRIDIAIDIFDIRKNVKTTPINSERKIVIYKNSEYINLWKKSKDYVVNTYDKGIKEGVAGVNVTRVELKTKSKKLAGWNIPDLHIPTADDAAIEKYISKVIDTFKNKVQISVRNSILELDKVKIKSAIYDILCYCHLGVGYKKLSNRDKAYRRNNKVSQDTQKRIENVLKSHKVILNDSIKDQLKKKKITQKSICIKAGVTAKTLRKTIMFYNSKTILANPTFSSTKNSQNTGTQKVSAKDIK